MLLFFPSTSFLFSSIKMQISTSACEWQQISPASCWDFREEPYLLHSICPAWWERDLCAYWNHSNTHSPCYLFLFFRFLAMSYLVKDLTLRVTVLLSLLVMFSPVLTSLSLATNSVVILSYISFLWKDHILLDCYKPMSIATKIRIQNNTT